MPPITLLTRYRANRLVFGAAAVAAALALATIVIAAAEGPPLQIADASPVYLIAVVFAGSLFGTWPAVGTSIVAVLLYDFLFIEPRFTLTVADPREWFDLLLFLFVAVVIGRLTALQTERTEEAARLARESQALFGLSRLLVTAPSLGEAAPTMVDRLARDARMERVWINQPFGSRERTLADTDPSVPPPAGTTVSVLARTPGDQPPRWVRAHVPWPRHPDGRSAPTSASLYRVKLEVDGDVLGSLWATRKRSLHDPTREETRLLALAADQMAMALRREQLGREATEAEIARRSDALKSALLDSVSHDLRTPLASIRAAAGSLMDPAVEWPPEERRAAAQSIDAEAERLSRLVRNILDLSRIEAGALRPNLEVFEVGQLVEPVIDRLAPILDGRPVAVDIPEDLPPMRVDAVFFDEVLTNLLENAARYAKRPARVRIAARSLDGEKIEVVVEDGGGGVPPEALPHLFDKFYRVARQGNGARRGLGIGLSVVRGLVEAMGGRAEARRSELGGLAIGVTLPAAPEPIAEELTT